MYQEERPYTIQQIVVTAAQMQGIEARLFAAGMPVAALMEKVAGRISNAVATLYPLSQHCQTVGILVGPGHNGGDALVVARELHFQGYTVHCHQPLPNLKELTATHAQYVASLGIPFEKNLEALANCHLIIDGLFGFGLNRALTGAIAHTVNTINRWATPIISIDLPSGIHTDTGAVLGTAINASHTFCLGLWKRAFLQDQALPYLGQVDLIDFDIPLPDIAAILGSDPTLKRVTPALAATAIPLPRSPITHKYKEGHALLICGSQQYMGAAILAGLAARASGVGLLSMAVPASLKMAMTLKIPDAITIACPETNSGVIAHLPESIDLAKYDAIACGPGLTLEALAVIQSILPINTPLILDADGLNGLATMGIKAIVSRPAPTILTPHLGEFRRLFPDLAAKLEDGGDRVTIAQLAASESSAIILLKGACTVVAHPDGWVWINPNGSPALARGEVGMS